MLHGFTGTGGSWLDLLPHLPAWRFLMPDLPGHGGTGPPPRSPAWRMEELGDALIGLCDSIDAGGRIDLVGYSMGGRLALHLGIRHPERVGRVVLIGASAGIESSQERAERIDSDEAIARLLEEEGIEPFVRHWESLPIFSTQQRLEPAVRRRVREGRLAQDPRSLAAALRAFGTGWQTPLHGSLSDLQVPVLLIVGSRDDRYRAIAQRMLALLPRGEVELVEGAGHAVALEEPRRCAAAIGSFLERETERVG